MILECKPKDAKWIVVVNIAYYPYTNYFLTEEDAIADCKENIEFYSTKDSEGEQTANIIIAELKSLTNFIEW